MHELSIALNLVEQASKAASDNGGTKVVELQILLGELCGVERDALEFCFPLASEGSIVEGAKLKIESQKAQGKCLNCGHQQIIEIPVFLCSNCSQGHLEVISGRDFLLQSIGVE
jgi:hydrogenase nickel incorporation protein HypA/HybF